MKEVPQQKHAYCKTPPFIKVPRDPPFLGSWSRGVGYPTPRDQPRRTTGNNRTIQHLKYARSRPQWFECVPFMEITTQMLLLLLV
jgi:hypothetical protein